MTHQGAHTDFVDDDLLDEEIDEFEPEGTHPLVVSSVAILAFLALLHTIALPLAYVIGESEQGSDAGYGPFVLAYIIAAIASTLIMGIGTSMASKK